MKYITVCLLAGKASLTSGFRLGRSKMLRSLSYMAAQSQRHHTIDRLEDRGVERGARRFCWCFIEKARGPSSVRRTLELFQRQRWGNFLETGWSVYGHFRAHRYHLELMNWTKSIGNCVFWPTPCLPQRTSHRWHFNLHISVLTTADYLQGNRAETASWSEKFKKCVNVYICRLHFIWLFYQY